MWTRVSWVLSVTEYPGLSFTPCATWELSVSLGHMSNARHEKIFPWDTQNLYAFAFRVSKVRFLFSMLLDIAQHPRSVFLFSDRKVFLSMSTLSLKWWHYFWIMTPKGFTIHLFCLSKHIRLILTTWKPGLRRCIIGNSLVLCRSVPGPLIPAKETSRQYLGNIFRTGFYRAPVLVCQSLHPALSTPSPHQCGWCYVVQAPGAPAGMGGMCPLVVECGTRCFFLQGWD